MRCSICGEDLPDDPPHYTIVLDRDDGTSEPEHHTARICESCWEQYQRDVF